LTGPWSEPEVVYRPERTSDEALFNAGKEHPEFAREGGRVIYMTFIDSTGISALILAMAKVDALGAELVLGVVSEQVDRALSMVSLHDEFVREVPPS